MKDDIIEQRANTEVEKWAVSLLMSLVRTAVEALNKKPFKTPDYVETTFRHGVTGMQIRVDFKEFSSSSEDQLVTPPENSDKDELEG